MLILENFVRSAGPSRTTGPGSIARQNDPVVRSFTTSLHRPPYPPGARPTRLTTRVVQSAARVFGKHVYTDRNPTDQNL